MQYDVELFQIRGKPYIIAKAHGEHGRFIWSFTCGRSKSYIGVRVGNTMLVEFNPGKLHEFAQAVFDSGRTISDVQPVTGCYEIFTMPREFGMALAYR